MVPPASVIGCGRPDCCMHRADNASSTDAAPESMIIAGYGMPLVGLLAFAAIAQACAASAVVVALAGLLGLALGARLAGRLSVASAAPT